jgi:hypothetical protein
MWTTVALLAALALAPGQNGELTLANVRTTYGIFGATRPDNKILPGDNCTISFDIEGAQADAGGKVQYSIAMEVSDSKGVQHYKQLPRDQEVKVEAGAKSLPACAHLTVGLDQEPGMYTVKLTVTDRTTKASKEVTRTYEVLPKGFGLVRYHVSSDPDGQKPAVVLRPGKPSWINFAAVGFERKDGQPNLAVVMRVLDENGQPALAKPSEGEVKQDVPEKALAVPLQFEVRLKDPGKYTIELKATDKVAGQSTTLSVPLIVAKAK